MDFQLECKIYRDQTDFDITCEIVAKSKKAIAEFGDCKLGFINLIYEKTTITYLVNKYNIPKNTITLDLVSRNKKCDKEEKLKGIGISMLCSVLNKLISTDFQYIYLYSMPGLVAFYKKHGFKVIEGYHMIGKISDIEKNCKYKLKVIYFNN